MTGLSARECSMMHHLTNRLALLPSPVVRSQLLIQISQLLDMAFLGDTSSERELELVRKIDALEDRLQEYEGEEIEEIE